MKFVFRVRPFSLRGNKKILYLFALNISIYMYNIEYINVIKQELL